MTPTPLTPITLKATEVIAAADATAWLTSFLANTPLPTGKTIAEISSGTFNVNPVTKAISLQIAFSS